ncbi:hypothetical protein L596_009490 [Steinernema carpocapsae]|uniref:Uncharacterized protein n=1 Tax=Steinernema carpocapsae TaxID=34508 RepID=A0A4U5PGA3_STECR|nr:hypothetical protein L596_009490 [Steinernema carpocapsae]
MRRSIALHLRIVHINDLLPISTIQERSNIALPMVSYVDFSEIRYGLLSPQLSYRIQALNKLGSSLPDALHDEDSFFYEITTASDVSLDVSGSSLDAPEFQSPVLLDCVTKAVQFSHALLSSAVYVNPEALCSFFNLLGKFLKSESVKKEPEANENTRSVQDVLMAEIEELKKKLVKAELADKAKEEALRITRNCCCRLNQVYVEANEREKAMKQRIADLEAQLSGAHEAKEDLGKIVDFLTQKEQETEQKTAENLLQANIECHNLNEKNFELQVEMQNLREKLVKSQVEALNLQEVLNLVNSEARQGHKIAQLEADLKYWGSKYQNLKTAHNVALVNFENERKRAENSEFCQKSLEDALEEAARTESTLKHEIEMLTKQMKAGNESIASLDTDDEVSET